MKIIGICGGSGSGKSTLALELKRNSGKLNIEVITMDSYYFNNSNLSEDERKEYNFDEPAAIDFNYLNSDIERLKKGEVVYIPEYDYATTTRKSGEKGIKPEILIIDGLFIFNNEEFKNKLDFSIFIDLDFSERLKRAKTRDLIERKRPETETEIRFKKVVNPMFEKYVEPNKYLADLVINDNLEHINLILTKIKEL